MRPIDKGSIPTDVNGVPIQITHYQQSRGHLIVRLGSYCSYCERSLGGGIAVEHIQPKSKVKNLALDWDNFLLACVNCNSTKKDKTINVNEYYWPDSDNTYKAFQYSAGALITPSPNLSNQDLILAQNTIKLTGLDRTPSDDPLVNPEMRDCRWRERRTAMEIAEHAKKNLAGSDNLFMRDQIVKTATATGFFSIWMTVFNGDADMKQRFVNAFPGTSFSCFDSNGDPVTRSGGKI